MKLFQLLLICVLMTLSQSMNCRKCSGSDGLCSSESDNGYQFSCNSVEKCWFEHGECSQKHFRCTANYFFYISTDTSDGQDKYYRHCGRGLETGCFIQTAENEVKPNVLDFKIHTIFRTSLCRHVVQFAFVIGIIAMWIMIVTIVILLNLKQQLHLHQSNVRMSGWI